MTENEVHGFLERNCHEVNCELELNMTSLIFIQRCNRDDDEDLEVQKRVSLCLIWIPFHLLQSTLDFLIKEA